MPKRIMQGTVVSTKMDKTIVVLVERRVRHPVMGKTIRRSKRLHAHDVDSAAKVGDTVRIQECQPISKTKSWILLNVASA